MATALLSDETYYQCLRYLLAGTAVVPEKFANVAIKGLQIDSRAVRPGDLFFAYPGLTTDSRQFITNAIQCGAQAVLVDKSGSWQDFNVIQGIPVIPIVQLQRKLSELSGRFYGNPSNELSVIGITGTNGKTSTSQFIAAMLHMLEYKSAVIGTLGNGFIDTKPQVLSSSGFTTPDAVALQKVFSELVSQGADAVAMEVSSHGLDQHRVEGVTIDVGVFTNLSHEHLDYHHNLVQYTAAKRRLFEMDCVQHKIINADDEVGRQFLQMFGESALSYSIQHDRADIYAYQVALLANKIDAEINTPWGKGALSIPLMGKFNLSNVLAAIGAICSLGVELDKVLSCVARLSPVPGRLEMIPTEESEPTVLVDYAHTPDALTTILQTLRSHTGGKVWCVFGCGGDRDRSKRSKMGLTVSNLADVAVVTSDNPRSEEPQQIIKDIIGGMLGEAEVVIEEERALAIDSAIAQAAADDIVVIAGKGHEDYQEIKGKKYRFNDREQVSKALRRHRTSGGKC